MRVLRASTYRRMPWKNGGGETIEIAVAPEGAPLDGFDWRVSMARVEGPGPFSIFPDVDRTLAILDGIGLDLRFAGRTVRLTRDSEPLAFAADEPVEASLEDGPITDLNVMTRRGRFGHRVRRIAVNGPSAVSCTGNLTLLLVQEGALSVRSDEEPFEAATGDTVLIQDSRIAVVEPASGSATLYVIDLWRQ